MPIENPIMTTYEVPLSPTRDVQKGTTPSMDIVKESQQKGSPTPDDSLPIDINHKMEDLSLDTTRTIQTTNQTDQSDPKKGTNSIGATVSSQSEFIIRLRTELSKSYTDKQNLKALCAGHIIPTEVRGELWKVLLEVSSKPDVIGSWQPGADIPTIALLRAECITEASRIPGLSHAEYEVKAKEMEHLLLFYCHARNKDYQSGWAEVALPFVCLQMPVWQAYNCFYAFVDRYVPYRHLNAKGSKNAQYPYAIFRLLLQYHDPKLSHYLDTLGVDPQSYLYSWFRSLMVGVVKDTNAGLSLWDTYLLEGDSYMIFFMALTLLINSRLAIMACRTESDATNFLRNLPQPLSPEDAEDFTACAKHYALQTPVSIRQKETSALLFGSNFTSNFRASQSSIHTASPPFLTDLCLPVTATEVCLPLANTTHNTLGSNLLVQSSTAVPEHFKFFIVDIRSSAECEAGRLPTAFHMDAVSIFDRPEWFESIIASFNRIAGDHICFYGSGPDDANLRTVIAFFLQREFRHISFIRGGFGAIHALAEKKMVELIDHDNSACRVCSPSTAITALGEININKPNPVMNLFTKQQKNPEEPGSTDNDNSASKLWRQVTTKITPAKITNPLTSLPLGLAGQKKPENDTRERKETEGDNKVRQAQTTTNIPSKATPTPQGNANQNQLGKMFSPFGTMMQKGKDAISKIQAEKEAAAKEKEKEKPPMENSNPMSEMDGLKRMLSQEGGKGLDMVNKFGRNMFGIGGTDDDSQSDDGSPTHRKKKQTEGGDLDQMQCVVLDEYTREIQALHEFPCSEILPSGTWVASCIVVTKDDFIILRTPMDAHPRAFVCESFGLRVLRKITASKHHPNIVRFTFKGPIGAKDDNDVTDEKVQANEIDSDSTDLSRRFMLPNGKACSHEVGKLVVEIIRRTGPK